MEMRRQERLPIEGEHGFGTLSVENRRYPALLVDESVNGIGLVLVRPRGLAVGNIVHLETPLRQLRAKVGSIRHLTPMAEEICRVGLEWLD